MSVPGFIDYLKLAHYLFFLFLCFGSEVSFAESSQSENWWTKAAKNYAGTSLRGITENTPASRYVANVLAPAFEKETGIRVRLEVSSWEEMYDTGIRDLSQGSGIYDFIFIEQDIIYAYLANEYLVNLSSLLKQYPDLASPRFSFKDFTSYIDFFQDQETGDVFGIPFESFLRFYGYRKDLFNDAEIKKTFLEEYGYPLKPAVSLQQFKDISVFFTDWGKKNNIELWGNTIQASPKHPASFYELFETVLPSFGIYNWGINQKLRAASVSKGGTLNSPVAKQGLQFWIDLLKIAPPESYGSTWNESNLSYLSGRVAHGWIYAEYLVQLATDTENSMVAGKVGAALPPLQPNVLEQAKKGKGYIGYYDGAAFGIPHSSKKQQAALLWLQYIGQPSVQVDWALATGRVVHNDTFNDPAIRAMDHRIGNYFSLIQNSGHLFAGAPPFAEHAAIREVIAPFIYQVIRGELTSSEALDLAALAVDVLLGADN